MQQKLVPDLFIILLSNPKQPLYARNTFKGMILWKRINKKPLKKVAFSSFWVQSLPMDQIVKNKRGLELVISRSSGYKKCQNNSSISYVLSDQVWWCNIKHFLSYSKNYICKFMQANSWHHKLFHFRLFFWIWKVWKWR